MVRRKKITDKNGQHFYSVFFVFVIALVFVTSIVVILLRTPEHVVDISKDGVVTVSGVSGKSSFLSIEKLPGVEDSVSFFIGPVYEIAILGGGTIEKSTIQYRLTDEIKQKRSSDHLSLFLYDPRVLDWRPIPSVWDEKTQTVFSDQPIRNSILIGLGITP